MGNFKHGESADGSVTPEFRTWCAIKHRCRVGDRRYHNRYAGRGIVVCERWATSFAAFLADMGRRPSDLHSIDRINNDGNYEPGNCRWATRSEQAKNRSFVSKRSRSRKIDGDKTAYDIADETGMPVDRIIYRYKKGYRGEFLYRESLEAERIGALKGTTRQRKVQP